MDSPGNLAIKPDRDTPVPKIFLQILADEPMDKPDPRNKEATPMRNRINRWK
jgi:hypothetical protein